MTYGKIEKWLISIHAPAGGATNGQDVVTEKEIISIHAPAGGATSTYQTGARHTSFQFTPLREGRHL